MNLGGNFVMARIGPRFGVPSRARNTRPDRGPIWRADFHNAILRIFNLLLKNFQ